MPGTQENPTLQTEIDALGAASAAPAADRKTGNPSAETCRKAFWQAALASQSLLLWIVTNLDV